MRNKLTKHTKVQVYTACVVSMAQCGSEARMLHSTKNKLNAFHLRCLEHVPGISWGGQFSEHRSCVFERAQVSGVVTQLTQGCLPWPVNHIPEDFLDSELACKKAD